jgi:hypothetical protein
MPAFSNQFQSALVHKIHRKARRIFGIGGSWAVRKWYKKLIPNGISSLLRFRPTVTIAVLALTICLVCPLAESFDHWDHTIQTGHDTEYTLVVLALCVGMAYSLTRLNLKRVLLSFVAKNVLPSFIQRVLCFTCLLTSLLFDATSPPPLPLRI